MVLAIQIEFKVTSNLFLPTTIFQILAAMQRELAASGLSPEEILAKTLLLQKAMAGDNSPAFINKTLKNALNVANLNPEDLAKVSVGYKAVLHRV